MRQLIRLAHLQELFIIGLKTHHLSGTANGNQTYNFATSDYATYNGTAGAAGGDGLIPTGFIPSGQGFFVSFSQSRPTSTGTVIFNNAMRVKGATNNSQFFKNTNTKGKTNTSVDNKIMG